MGRFQSAMRFSEGRGWCAPNRFVSVSRADSGSKIGTPDTDRINAIFRPRSVTLQFGSHLPLNLKFLARLSSEVG